MHIYSYMHIFLYMYMSKPAYICIHINTYMHSYFCRPTYIRMLTQMYGNMLQSSKKIVVIDVQIAN